jgi:8-hydroxy-5-deazaflavin:NADPH oxidoreductase
MRIAIIGTGKMGLGFAAALGPEHDVTVGSRDPDRARKKVARAGGPSCATYADAAAGADVVILAVPWRAMEETLFVLGDPDGVVIDVSNPMNQQERDDLRGRSAAEVIQDRVPRAKVCKAWNHVFAKHLSEPEVNGIAASVLIAGDDRKAKATVSTLARQMGFHPVDVGPLKEARGLEKLIATMFFVKLGPIRVLSDR